VVVTVFSPAIRLLIDPLLTADQVGLAGALASVMTLVWGLMLGGWLAREA